MDYWYFLIYFEYFFFSVSSFTFFFSKNRGNFCKIAKSFHRTISSLFQIFRWKLVFQCISDDFRRVLIKILLGQILCEFCLIKSSPKPKYLNTFSLSKKKFSLKTFWNHPKCKKVNFCRTIQFKKKIRMTSWPIESISPNSKFSRSSWEL